MEFAKVLKFKKGIDKVDLIIMKSTKEEGVKTLSTGTK